MANDDVFDIPDRFVDRTTGLIMHDPVITVTGRNWERSSISQWLSSQGTCPDTREEIAEYLLYPNVDLRSEIRDFVDKFWNKISLDEYSNPEWLQDLKYRKMGAGSLQEVIRVFNEELPKLLDDEEGDEHTGDWVIDIPAGDQIDYLLEENREPFFLKTLKLLTELSIPLTIFLIPPISTPIWLYYLYENERVKRDAMLPEWIVNENAFPVNSPQRNALWKSLAHSYGVAFAYAVFIHHLIAYFFIDDRIFEKMTSGELRALYHNIDETQQWAWSGFYTCFALFVAFGATAFHQIPSPVARPVRFFDGATLPSQHTPTITQIDDLDALEAGLPVVNSPHGGR